MRRCLGKELLSRGNSQCGDPESGVSLIYLRIDVSGQDWEMRSEGALST